MGAYFKDERSLGGRGGRPNAVTISNSDVIVLSNNDVILRSEGGGGKKSRKIVVILRVSPLTLITIKYFLLAELDEAIYQIGTHIS